VSTSVNPTSPQAATLQQNSPGLGMPLTIGVPLATLSAQQVVKQAFVASPPEVMAKPAAKALREAPSPQIRTSLSEEYARQFNDTQLRAVLTELGTGAVTDELKNAIAQNSPPEVSQAVAESLSDPATAAKRDLIAANRVFGENENRFASRMFANHTATMARPTLKELVRQLGDKPRQIHGEGEAKAQVSQLLNIKEDAGGPAQLERLDAVAKQVLDVGGPDAKITPLPYLYNLDDAKNGGVLSSVLLKVEGKNAEGKAATTYVDDRGYKYCSPEDFRCNNQLPAVGVCIAMPKDGQISYDIQGNVEIDTGAARVEGRIEEAVRELHIKEGALGVGMVCTGILLCAAAPVGLLAGTGLAAVAGAVAGGIGVYGALSGGIEAYNTKQHGGELGALHVAGLALGATGAASPLLKGLPAAYHLATGVANELLTGHGGVQLLLNREHMGDEEFATQCLDTAMNMVSGAISLGEGLSQQRHASMQAHQTGQRINVTGRQSHADEPVHAWTGHSDSDTGLPTQHGGADDTLHHSHTSQDTAAPANDNRDSLLQLAPSAWRGNAANSNHGHEAQQIGEKPVMQKLAMAVGSAYGVEVTTDGSGTSGPDRSNISNIRMSNGGNGNGGGPNEPTPPRNAGGKVIELFGRRAGNPPPAATGGSGESGGSKPDSAASAEGGSHMKPPETPAGGFEGRLAKVEADVRSHFPSGALAETFIAGKPDDSPEVKHVRSFREKVAQDVAKVSAEVEAVLVERTETQVRLKKADGQVIAVPIDKLSEAEASEIAQLIVSVAAMVATTLESQ